MPFGGSLYMNVVRFGFAGIDGHMAEGSITAWV